MQHPTTFLRQMRARFRTLMHRQAAHELRAVSETSWSNSRETLKQTVAALTLALLPTTALAAPANDPAVVRVRDAQERQRMADYVATHVSPQAIVSSFTTTTGDVVDCVDIYAQPALKQPGMAHHVIEFAPKTFPEAASQHAAEAVAEHGPDAATPEQGVGLEPSTIASPTEQCPKGFVPIRRLTQDTLERFETLEEFRKKVPNHLGHVRDFDRDDAGDAQQPALDLALPQEGATSLHQYAHAYRYVNNWGAESVINLWNPYTERTNEFSLSQIWVVRGSGADRETVEAGWQKYRDLYGDWRARLFIYFTPDNYGSGGCYNLTCGAFVQTNNSVYIGGAFSEYSQVGGAQKAIKLLWYKDGTYGHWWLRYGETWVGYYPRTRFDANGLRNYGAKIDFGGEIIDRQTNGRHTYTDMGSGRWPSAGYSYAAYHRALKYVDTSNSYRNASSLIATRTDLDCYDISLRSSSGSWGNYFYFGGPGYNSSCE